MMEVMIVDIHTCTPRGLLSMDSTCSAKALHLCVTF